MRAHHAFAGGLDGVDKMSKSKNNYIGITEDANTMFAKVLSISDTLMWDWYTLLSFKSLDEIAALKAEVAAGRNPKDAKVALAMAKSRPASTALQRPMRPSKTSSTAARAACPTIFLMWRCPAHLWALVPCSNRPIWRHRPARPTV